MSIYYLPITLLYFSTTPLQCLFASLACLLLFITISPCMHLSSLSCLPLLFPLANYFLYPCILYSIAVCFILLWLEEDWGISVDNLSAANQTCKFHCESPTLLKHLRFLCLHPEHYLLSAIQCLLLATGIANVDFLGSQQLGACDRLFSSTSPCG